MAASRSIVRFTANFEANLAQIEGFWTEREAPQAYATLLDDLALVVDSLERHPRIGRRFLTRTAQSVEARDRLASLIKQFGNVEVREYLSGDYLLLYSIGSVADSRKSATNVYLLAIKHHLQVSFDFGNFWRSRREDAE